MDTFKYCVLIVTFAALVCVQNITEAAIGHPCNPDAPPTGNCTAQSEVCFEGKCECSENFYPDGDNCLSITELLPTFRITGSDLNSITVELMNVPSVNSSYTDVITAHLNPGGINKTLSKSGITTIDGLTAATDYDVTVTRTITFGERSETTDPTPQQTTKTKSSHGGSCASDSDCAPTYNLKCHVPNSQTSGVCVCSDGNYYNGSLPCVSITGLVPTFRITGSDLNSITVEITNIPSLNSKYTDEITAHLNPGNINKPLNPSGTTSIGGLAESTDYTVTVTRTITFGQRSQITGPTPSQSSSTKSSHGGSCASDSDCDSTNNLKCHVPSGVCVCPDGNYFNGSLPCVSITELVPTFRITGSDLNSITVEHTITPIVNSKYTDVITAHLNPGNINKPLNPSGTTRIDELAASTPYTVTVTRTITFGQRSQTTDPTPSQSSSTKSNHGGSCVSDSDCAPTYNLKCLVPTGQKYGVCVCPDGNYYNGSLPCVSITGLVPTFQITDSHLDSITVQHTIIPIVNSKYTDVITAHINQGITDKILNPSGTTVIGGLTEATVYTVTVTRTITFGQRSQTTAPTESKSYSTKVSYGNGCSTNGTCINNNANCYGTKCLCNEGFYRNTESTQCNQLSDLAPRSITHESVETTRVVVRWVESDKKAYVSGYRVYAVPTTSGDPSPQPELVTGTSTTVMNLQPGTQYNVIVEAKSTNEERVEYTAGSPVTIFTKPASITGINEGKSNFTGPDIIIAFSPAVVKYTGYTVRLKGVGSDTYDETLPATNTNNIYRVTFPGVTIGNYYDITVMTLSGSVQSDPFTTRRRVMAAQASEVQAFTRTAITSRSVYVTWKRPNQPNGILFEYSLEVSNNKACDFRIVFNCTECVGNRTDDAMSDNCRMVDTMNISEANINDVNHINEYNITGLDPVTGYFLVAVAYTEQGRGQVPSNEVYIQTEAEAARAPKFIRSTRTTSDTITLMWEPETPRPGVTSYEILVYEKIEDSERFAVIENRTVLGYYSQSLVITNLSSYWQYYFAIQAYTHIPPRSQIVNISQPVTTEESAPAQVEYISAEQGQGKFNKILVKWKCPKQKDGRNGVITSANLTYYSQEEKLPKSTIYLNMKDCMWEEEVDVTPGSNYTFTVYLNNRFHGEERSVYHYIPVGPPLFTQTILKLGSGLKTETSAPLEICPACIHNNNNGKVVKTGLLVCKLGSCPTRIPGETFQDDYYDKIPNWDAAKGNGFTSWYRPTSDDWLAGNQDKEKITFILGSETCGLEDQNEYCNGPLSVKNTFRVWFFACTSAGCAESDHLEITLGLETEGTLPVSTTAAIVCSIAVVIIIIIVVTVVYFKVLKPRSQNETRTKYKTTTTQDQTHTYDEITGGQRLSVIKDGRQDHDYYNTMAPQSDNTYDQLSPYFNTDHHDYGRVNVTQT